MRDLHTLTRDLGLDAVARAIEETPRAVRGWRSGERPIDVDVLYRTKARFPDFDIDGTVRYIGARREVAARVRARRTSRR